MKSERLFSGPVAAVIAALLAVLAVPFLLRPEDDLLAKADDTLVIITPHNEAIRHEFARAFAAHHRARTGRTVRVDWRSPGGGSEIARYLQGEYLAAFQNHWERTLRRPWSAQVQNAFANKAVAPDDTPEDDTEEQAARRAFLAMEAGIGIDLFFGGGGFEFVVQAEAGNLVDCGLIGELPDLFGPSGIPQMLGGELYWDKAGRWIGTCLSAFGLVYNLDALARLGVREPPTTWRDLARPELRGQVALADPTKSGSAAKAFEMLVQQCIQERLAAGGGDAADPAVLRAARDAGWEDGLRLIRRIAANARYFTDSASKVPLDVALGDAAAGMAIDFYGRFQSESVRGPDGRSRMLYVNAAGGSSVGPDPIGLLRGAPHRELALEFVRFVLSVEGQKLWNYRPGTPGGPERFALRRLPIRRELYGPEHRPFVSDPGVDPYAEAAAFQYRAELTAPLFRVLSLAVRAMCLDPDDELRAAWRALAEAGFPPEATRTFDDVAPLAYARAAGPVRETMRSADRIREVEMTRELAGVFRQQYREAARLARERR